jgi:hypothetical protein
MKLTIFLSVVSYVSSQVVLFDSILKCPQRTEYEDCLGKLEVEFVSCRKVKGISINGPVSFESCFCDAHLDSLDICAPICLKEEEIVTKLALLTRECSNTTFQTRTLVESTVIPAETGQTDADESAAATSNSSGSLIFNVAQYVGIVSIILL